MSTRVSSSKLGPFGAFLGSLATFYDRRLLIKYLTQRQITRGYQGSYLGLLWVILGPLLAVAMLTLIFSEMLGIRFREVTGDSTLNFGLFLYCGIVPFLAFAQALNQGANIIRRNSNLVQEVVFPLEILPLTSVITSVVRSLLGVGALMIVLMALEHRLPHVTVLLLPLVLVLQLLFTLGLCCLTSVIVTYVPDLRETLRVFVRGMFFITPILWPTGRVPEEWSFLVDYNPLAFLVEAYRDLILEGELPGAHGAIYFSLCALVLFVVGLAVFNRTKRKFADLI